MKSKTSFFNKTVFWKNVTLFWPIWTVYTIVLLLTRPFLLWVQYNDSLRYSPLTQNDKLEYLLDVLIIQPDIVMITIAAVIAGMAVYSYLYNSRSANMIHSLPVDRTQLFGTNMISGLAFLAVPQLITFFVTVLMCLCNGVVNVEYVAWWFLMVIALDIIIFSIVTFCAFFTGQLVTMPIYVLVVNCLSLLVYGIVELVVGTFAYGINSGSTMNYDIVCWFSPIIKLYNNVGLGIKEYDNYGNILEVGMYGLQYVLIYLFVAVLLYMAAYLVYKKRKIEQAGDLLTVEWVKPIFRWGVGTSGAVLCSIGIREIFSSIGKNISMPVFILILLVLGLIFYIVADMFVKKTFRVIKKKYWPNYLTFSLLLLATFGGLYGYARYSENYIPDQEDIKIAAIDYSYTSLFYEDDVDVVLDLHERILENKEEYRNLDYYTDDWSYIRINYTLNNGDTCSRAYRVSTVGEGGEIFRQICDMELDAENFLTSNIGQYYKDVEGFSNGNISYVDNIEDYEQWENVELSAEQCKKVYEAIIADAKAGNLQKYNLMSDIWYDYYSEKREDVEVYYEYSSNVYISYYLPDDVAHKILEENADVKEGNGWYYDEDLGIEFYYQVAGSRVTAELYLNFGKKCTNIVNALIECGVIESADDIIWEYPE